MAACTLGISTANTANASSYASGAFTPAADDLLVCFITKTTSINIGSMSDSLGDGGAWNDVVGGLYNTDVSAVLVFVRNKVVTATSMTVTYDCTGDAASGCVIQVVRVSGMKALGGGAVRQFATQENQAASTTPAPVFALACLTGNPTLSLVGNLTNPAAVLIPSGWTDRNNTGYANPTTGARCVSRDSGFTGTTITWGGTSASVFADIAIELDSRQAFVPEIEQFAASGGMSGRRWV